MPTAQDLTDRRLAPAQIDSYRRDGYLFPLPVFPADAAAAMRASHRSAILPHADSDDPDNLLSRGQEVQVRVPDADKVPIELQPGQISLHHGLTIHGSDPNTTDDRRIAGVVRYCTPDVAQQVSDKDYAVLARGVDRCGNFVTFIPPSSPFTPASLALYDEIRTSQAKAMMAGAARDSKGLCA